MIRVLIADDHEVIRFALGRLLGAEADMEVVGHAPDGLAAVAMTLRDKPDVVLMDLSMPRFDGVAATREITRLAPSVRVLMLTLYSQLSVVRDALAAGAAGYLLKDTESGVLLASIRAVERGERPLTHLIREALEA